MDKNRALVEITPEFLLELLQLPCGEGVVKLDTNVMLTCSGIPADAKALRVGVNEMGNLMLLLEHESFDKTIEGQQIQRLDPTWTLERHEREEH